MYTIDNEPIEAAQAREKILTAFSDLTFQEEGHIYTLNSKQLRSASGIGELFYSRPFNSKLISANYAKKHPEKDAAGWREVWRLNAEKSATQGSLVHAFGESLAYLKNGHPEMILDCVKSQYDAATNTLTPQHPEEEVIVKKEEAIVKFLNELPKSYHLVLNEAMAYSGKNPDPEKNLKEQVCGTFDMLYYDDGNGNPDNSGFVILDYKTNKTLIDEYSRKFEVRLIPPFQNYYQEAKSGYTIQLSLYASMLEDIGLKIKDRILVWLKDDGTYERIHVDDVTAKLRSLPRFPQPHEF